MVPINACFNILPTIASWLFKTSPDVDWLLPIPFWLH